MKLIAFSDLHCHPWATFAGSGERGLNTRLLDCLNVIEDIVKLALEHNVDAVLFGGDFFHGNKIDVETYALGAGALKRLAEVIDVYVVAGNHDQASRYLDLDALKPMQDAHLTVFDGFRREYDNGAMLTGHGYRKRKDECAKPTPDDRYPQIALMHAGVRGGELAAYFKSAMEQDWTPEELYGIADLVVVGHYHKPQTFARDGRVVLVPGAPLQHTWGDAGQERGVWLIDVAQGRAPKVKMIPLTRYPKFIKATVDEVAEHPEKFHGNFVQVALPGDADKALIDDLTELLKETTRGFALHADRPEVAERAGQRLNLQKEFDVIEAVDQYVETFAPAGMDKGKLKDLAKKFLG